MTVDAIDVPLGLSSPKITPFMRLIAAFLLLCWLNYIGAQPINRKAVVQRHTVVNNNVDSLSSLTVGNGSFAYTVDVTGMQSFPVAYQHGTPLGTQSEWGWHSFPNPEGYQFSEALKTYHLNGQDVTYAVQVKEPERVKKAVDWLRQNPHRLQLGNWGMQFIKKNGTIATINDVRNINQTMDMWAGTITSSFQLEGMPVMVKTVCHPTLDLISVQVKSDLIAAGRLRFNMRFPYPTNGFTDEAVYYANKDQHQSSVVSKSATEASVVHQLDSTQYYTQFQWKGIATITSDSLHSFIIQPGKALNSFEISCFFIPETRGSTVLIRFPGTTSAPVRVSTNRNAALPLFSATNLASTAAWQRYWTTGAAIDFGGSTDPRAKELERRMILSQYLMKTQEAGRFPPQETGLTYNSWYGRPHLEMVWWHAVHYALWDKIEYLEKLMPWYAAVADEAFQLAKRQGYDGLRWQKMTDTLGKEGPSSVGAFLIWQQPHYIYFAELIYRAHPTQRTLQQYQKLLFATADFMASYARYDSTRKNYVLGKGLIPAQERFKAEETFNPTFELVYWHWALTTAQQWRRRLNMQPDAKYQHVLDHLSPLPVQDSLYLATESATDSYTNPEFRTDHPAVLGALGYLPLTPQTDTARMHRTFNWIWDNWSWKDTWGWDFPLTAMTATRLGQPEQAVQSLLMPITTNTYLRNGHNYQDERLRLYMPGNGGLLTALAMMCAGYDGSKGIMPGIPKNSGWNVRWEGLQKMP